MAQVVDQAQRQLQQARDAWRQQWEQQAVQLVCRIAACCLRQTKFDSAGLARKLVEESLRGLPLEGRCEIHLHPEDHRELADEPQWSAEEIVVVADASVERGGCVVRTAAGQIDQTLSSQLRRIEEELVRL